MIPSNLSQQGHEIALNTIAYNIGRWMAAKILGKLQQERKAADSTDERPAIDRYNDFVATQADAELEHEQSEDSGQEAPVTLEQLVNVFVTSNDELETLSAGKKWPRPVTIEQIITGLKNQKPGRVTEDKIAATQAMIKAHSGRELPREDVVKLVADERAAEAEYFNTQYGEFGDDITNIVNKMIVGTFESFDTHFDNLPQRHQLALLKMIDMKLNFKADELLTGQAFGRPSPTARIPALIRGGMIAEIRGDQVSIKESIDQLAHAEDRITA